MNREIKFRAWGYNAISGKYEMRSHESIKNNCGAYFFEPNKYQPNPHILMQFTGLTDKNGKEIYEGDIVKWENDVSEGYKRVKSGKGVIKWNKDYCMFDVSFMTNIQATQYFMIDIISTLKIIGNIYENPELL